MATNIFNISNNKDAINGKWCSKESLYNMPGFRVGEKVIVKQVHEKEMELGEKTREELIAMVEAGGKFAYRDVDFGEMGAMAEMFDWEEPEWNYIYSSELL